MRTWTTPSYCGMPLADAERHGLDVVGLPRNHWLDLWRHERKTEWYPDHQWRLTRQTVRWKHRIHPAIIEPVKRDVCPIIHIEHFNTALRTDEDWAATTRHYNRILELDRAESGRDLSGFGLPAKDNA